MSLRGGSMRASRSSMMRSTPTPSASAAKFGSTRCRSTGSATRLMSFGETARRPASSACAFAPRIERLPRARPGAPAHVALHELRRAPVVGTRRAHERRRVAQHRLGRRDLARQPLQRDQLRRRRARRRASLGAAPVVAAKDRDLFVFLRDSRRECRTESGRAALRAADTCLPARSDSASRARRTARADASSRRSRSRCAPASPRAARPACAAARD